MIVSLSLQQNVNDKNSLFCVVFCNVGQVTLVCIGPLTNIALAIRTFRDFEKYVKGLYIMGGNYTGKQTDTIFFINKTFMYPKLLYEVC